MLNDGLMSGPRSFSKQGARENTSYNSWILLFVVIKTGLNLLAMPHFGFQRDELLYLVLGDHLDWGYNEIPPFIALLAKVTTTFFGTSLFSARIFSAIFSGLIVWFTGRTTVELGGGRFAILLACLAVTFSPAFAASGYLFEPVVFDQFWWLLTAWLIVRYINTKAAKYLYFTGIVVGIAMLTKYTIVFFAIALILGLLCTPQRKILWNRRVAEAFGLAMLIFLPNVIWEFVHHFPFFAQMRELQSSQLAGNTPGNFFTQQLLINFTWTILWLAGLGLILFSAHLRQYRFLGLAYIFTFAFLMIMHGKDYYILGAYPMLFAAGGYGIEKWATNKSRFITIALALALTLPNLFALPLALPILPLDRTIGWFSFIYKNVPYFNFEAKWEDNKLHPISQNYGDMIGWDEMTQKVARVYDSLSPEQRRRTQIYADNYGEASSLHWFGKKYHLPEVICLNSSFSLWAPQKFDADYIIYVDETGGNNIKKLQTGPDSLKKMDEISNPLAIEKGAGIYLIAHPQEGFIDNYRKAFARKQLE
jgi:hypothetical protein